MRPHCRGCRQGFVRQIQFSDPAEEQVAAILWEAVPDRFLARYPDSGLVETYGGEDQWADVHCIDYWIYVDHQAMRARLSVEGWNLHEIGVPLRGDVFDGARLADLFARILNVRSPRA